MMAIANNWLKNFIGVKTGYSNNIYRSIDDVETVTLFLAIADRLMDN